MAGQNNTQERTSRDLWIGSKTNPAIVLGGVTAGETGTKGKMWLKLLINEEQKNQIEEQFAAEIADAKAKVEIQRNAKVLEFGGDAVPGAREQANAACIYRNWFKPVIKDNAVVPGQYEVSVSQTSPAKQLEGNYNFGVIRVKYYSVSVDNKAHLFGSSDNPIGVAVPSDSKVAIRLNCKITESPNKSGYGLGLNRMAQVLIFEFGEGFGGGDTLPEGIEMAEEASTDSLPAHVQAMMAKQNSTATKSNEQQQQQNVNQNANQNPYGQSLGQNAQQNANQNPYGQTQQNVNQNVNQQNPYGQQQQPVENTVNTQQQQNANPYGQTQQAAENPYGQPQQQQQNNEPVQNNSYNIPNEQQQPVNGQHTSQQVGVQQNPTNENPYGQQPDMNSTQNAPQGNVTANPYENQNQVNNNNVNTQPSVDGNPYSQQ